MSVGENPTSDSDTTERIPESYDVFAGIKAEQQRELTATEQERAEKSGRIIAARALSGGNTWVTIKSLQHKALSKSLINGIQQGWDIQNGGDGTGRNLKNAGLQIIGPNRVPRQEARLAKYIERLKTFEPSCTQRRLVVLYDIDKILKFDENLELKDVLFDLFKEDEDITWVVLGTSKPRDLRGIEPDDYVDFVMTMNWGVVVDNEGIRKNRSSPVLATQSSTRPSPDEIMEPGDKNGYGGPREITKRVKRKSS